MPTLIPTPSGGHDVEVLMSGLMPLPRQILPGYDSGVLAMAIGAFLLAVIGLRGAGRIWSVFFRDLTHGGPATSMAATAEPTTGERWSVIAMLIQTFVCEGLLIFAAVHYNSRIPLPPQTYFSCAALCAGCCALLYMVQWIGYRTVAYAFAPNPATDSRSWLRAFSTTQSILGLGLLLPAMGALFYPAAATAMICGGAALYISARILFIIKGFRIFYVNPFSLFYFFLYLCTMEILPLYAVAYAVVEFSHYVIT